MKPLAFVLLLTLSACALQDQPSNEPLGLGPMLQQALAAPELEVPYARHGLADTLRIVSLVDLSEGTTLAPPGRSVVRISHERAFFRMPAHVRIQEITEQGYGQLQVEVVVSSAAA